MERGIGQWKRRFHVLHGEIRVSPPAYVCRIIQVCTCSDVNTVSSTTQVLFLLLIDINSFLRCVLFCTTSVKTEAFPYPRKVRTTLKVMVLLVLITTHLSHCRLYLDELVKDFATGIILLTFTSSKLQI